MVTKGSTMGATSFVLSSSFLAVAAAAAAAAVDVFEAMVGIVMMVAYDGEYTFFSTMPEP